ncbi:MAG: zinc metallopeptidase [Oribacterium sp.]|nr:zinc metallopeptidase [Oribacterium sp.]
MIKVDNITETSDVKSEVSRPYLNIKPMESMSDQEAADFISKEFEDAHNVAEFDTYDKLLSEIFNRSEDEISIDFLISDKINEILDDFHFDKWEAMSEAEKVDSINELAKAVGEALGLDAIPVIDIVEGDDSYGFYDPKNNIITLNSNFFSDPVELVNTLTHEMRHAYQHMRAEMLETWEDALYKVNFDNYISPMPLPGGGWLFFVDYFDQYVEVDARAFANKFTEAMV